MMKLQSTRFEVLSGRVLLCALGRIPYRCVWLTGGGSSGCSTFIGIFKTIEQVDHKCAGVQVKLRDPLTTCVVPQRFWGEFPLRGAIAKVHAFTCRPYISPKPTAYSDHYQADSRETWYSFSLWINLVKEALRYGTHCHWITQFYLPPIAYRLMEWIIPALSKYTRWSIKNVQPVFDYNYGQTQPILAIFIILIACDVRTLLREM